MQRRIWVKRPGASATRVAVNEDDEVDNVRDVILQKYANSLGRTIDSPDITLKICSREPTNKSVSSERVLGPEEPIGRTLDTYYPGGQQIDEALIIEIPQRRTPRPSPRVGNHQIPYYIPEEIRPGEGAREYFPPMPAALQSPRLTSHLPHPNDPRHPSAHSMTVLTTGQLPPLPSPGSHGSHRHSRQPRPKYGRQHTSSPTILHTVQSSGTLADPKQPLNGIQAPTAAPLPTPPASQVQTEHKPSITPPNRASSPHSNQRNRRAKKTSSSTNPHNMTNDHRPLPTRPASASLLDGTVPPINVLIVEDNVINLKLLEAFMKRLKVRWKSAMNGREAVNTWRTGGFHLVLMDIQLPVMNGLEATKEIRRLEGVNGIGVFSGSPVGNGQKAVMAPGAWGSPSEEDRLPDKSLFMSPVIIVALTASSLQSDRHEALAAGCNDFLTKPVNFVWMERKVTEWGCMQALIDYDGWRKWKDYASNAAKQGAKSEKEEKEEKAKTKAALRAMFSKPPPKFDSKETSPPALTTIAAAAATTAAPKTGGESATTGSATTGSAATAAITTANTNANATMTAQHTNGAVKKPGGGGRSHKGRSSGILGTTLESKEEG